MVRFFDIFYYCHFRLVNLIDKGSWDDNQTIASLAVFEIFACGIFLVPLLFYVFNFDVSYWQFILYIPFYRFNSLYFIKSERAKVILEEKPLFWGNDSITQIIYFLITTGIAVLYFLSVYFTSRG